MTPDWLLAADAQQQVAASRRLLRAGQLQRQPKCLLAIPHESGSLKCLTNCKSSGPKRLVARNVGYFVTV